MSKVYHETCLQSEVRLSFSQSMTPGETRAWNRVNFFPLSPLDIRPHFYRAFRKEMSIFCINLPKEKPAAVILAEDNYTP